MTAGGHLVTLAKGITHMNDQTKEPRASRISEKEVLRRGAELRDLSVATLEELLAYGLTDNASDPVKGLVEDARDALDFAAHMIERAGQPLDADISVVGPVLDQTRRRLDVALELMERFNSSARPASPDPSPPTS